VRISYNCYFIQIPYGIDIKLFVSHTKRVNLWIVFIKFIDELLILTSNNSRRFCFKKSSQYFTSNKEKDQCDHNNKRSIAQLFLESLE